VTRLLGWWLYEMTNLAGLRWQGRCPIWFLFQNVIINMAPCFESFLPWLMLHLFENLCNSLVYYTIFIYCNEIKVLVYSEICCLNFFNVRSISFFCFLRTVVYRSYTVYKTEWNISSWIHITVLACNCYDIVYKYLTMTRVWSSVQQILYT
jgi:hypothetical protein